MSDPDTGDTVVSRRRDAAADTVISGRSRSAHVDGAVADTVLPSDERTDATALSSRRRGAPALGERVAEASVSGAPADRRDAYEPDAASLRAAMPVRAPQPVIVPRRTPPAVSSRRTVHERVDRERVDRATRAHARRRVVWLVVACAGAAAAAAALLILLPL